MADILIMDVFGSRVQFFHSIMLHEVLEQLQQPIYFC
jgi:hypothetical protein